MANSKLLQKRNCYRSDPVAAQLIEKFALSPLSLGLLAIAIATGLALLPKLIGILLKKWGINISLRSNSKILFWLKYKTAAVFLTFDALKAFLRRLKCILHHGLNFLRIGFFASH